MSGIVYVGVAYRGDYDQLVCGVSSTRARAKQHVDDVIGQVLKWDDSERLIDRDGLNVGRVLEFSLT